jgi:hypothetical protein
MNAAYRNYTLRALHDLKPGDHLCCLYATEAEHRAVVTPFLRQGLERNEKVFYIIDSRTAETILQYLRDDGVDVDAFITRKQLLILAQDDSYVRGGIFDPDKMIALLQAETTRALEEGYSALRVTGEMTWALRGLPGSDRVIEYEIKLNQFMETYACVAICQYDRRRFSPPILLDVLRTHPIAVIGAELYDNFYYIPPERLQGQDLADVELNSWIESLQVRKRTEQQIRALAKFPNEDPNPVLRVDRDSSLLYANKGSQPLLETWGAHGPVGEEPDLSWETADLHMPEAVRRAVHQALASGVQQDIEISCATRVFSLTLVPVADSEYVNLYGFDITERKQEEQARERELRTLEYYSQNAKSAVTAETFNLMPLHKSAPESFHELVRQYEQVLELALEQNLYKVEHDVSEQLRTVADRLGFYRAGPRDAVNIHILALNNKTREQTSSQVRAYADIGRMKLLELMGYLVSYYRNYGGEFGSGAYTPVARHTKKEEGL